MPLNTNQRASAVGTDSQKAAVLAGANLRPEILLVIAQAETGTTETLNQPFRVFPNSNYGSLYGFGSPFALALDSLFNADDSLEVWGIPVGDPGSGVAADADITVSAGTVTKSATISINAKGIIVNVAIAKGDDQDTVATKILNALTAQVRLPFDATINTGVTDNVVDLSASFEGTYGNDISLSVVDPDGNAVSASTYGVSITESAFSNGAGTIDISTAIANIPENLKITRIINQADDTNSLDSIEGFGVDRRDPLLGERIISYYGKQVDTSTMGTVNTAFSSLISIAAARKNDLINSLLPSGASGLPIEFVADMVARVAKRYALTPGKPPRGIKCLNPVSRPLTSNWFSAVQSNDLYIGGVANFEYVNQVYRIMDLCVFYNPDGDSKLNPNQPIDKDDEDITAIGNMLYDMKLIFSNDPWLAIKFIAENDISSSPDARKLSDVEVTVDNRIDVYVNNLFLKDAQFAKDNKVIVFDETNPERVDILLKAKLATTGRVYDVTLSLFKAAA